MFKNDDDPILSTLREVFAPLIKFTIKLPPVFAYGIIFVLLIIISVILDKVIEKNILILLGVISVCVLIAYILIEAGVRKPQIVKEEKNENEVEIEMRGTVVDPKDYTENQ